MTDDTFYKILPQIPKLTNHPVRLHMDGEPTMHPKFYDYAKEINNIGYSVALVTNGVKLEPRFTDLDMSIGINLSTSEEELKSRSKLKYERYIESLSQYVSAWNRDCSNQTIALNIYLNADEAKDVEIVDGKIEFAHKLLGDIGLSNILRNDAQQNPVLFFRNAGQGRLTVNLSRIASGGLYPETAKSKQVFMDREYGFCDSLWKRLAILYDGSIQGCCIDLFGTLRISSPEDLDSMSVREIWENNEMLGHYRESFLKGIPPHETCKKCLDRIATREMYTRFHIEWDADLK